MDEPEPHRERRTPRLPWRPTKWTQELQDKLCDQLRRGVPVGAACDLCRIARETYYNWIGRGKTGEKPYASFLDAVASARAECHADLLRHLYDSASGRNRNCNVHALEFFLSRAFRDDWGQPKIEIEQRVVNAQDVLDEWTKGGA